MKARSAPPATIDEYIAGFPRDIQAILQRRRRTIRKAAPDAQEAIKYQLPTFVLHGNLVHFGAFREHIGFYPTPSGITAFKKHLAKYPSARGSVQFPLNEPIPFDLIEKIVAFRVREDRGKAAGRSKRRC